MDEPSDDLSNEATVIAALVGTVLGERYSLERVLGAGGMGAVFEGKDLRLGRAVAIKVMLPGFARDAEYTKRFLREAQTCSMIRHRNVVVILDYGKTEAGLVYSVMELLAGQDLEVLLRGQPEQRLPWAVASGLLVQIASGLKAAHGKGVIHRDIKPANCFLTTEDDEPVVKVVDFGIAKLGEGAQTQQLTGTGNVLGTPSYTAPEMVLTGGPASPRSDVYSLGVVAYRMLTGRLPFTGKTAFEVMHHACIHPVPPMRDHGVELPAGVEALVMAMLSKAPEQRPADMGEVRQRLLALGGDAGAVPGVVNGAASSSLRIEVGAGGSGSGAGEVTRTEVLDSGSTTPVPRAAVPRAAPEPGPAVEVATARTEVLVGAGFREPAGRALAEPVVAGPVVERTEVLDSGKVERLPGKSAGWLVVAGVMAVAVLGGVGWVMIGDPTPEGTVAASTAAAVVVEEPQPEAKEKVVVEEPQPEAKEKVVVEEPQPEPVEVEAAQVKPPVAEEPKPSSKPPVVKPKPSGPSDAELKKTLARKIKAKCAAEMDGKRVTVSFFVTNTGAVSLLTATPKNAAGECAKQQVVGTKFRPRNGEDTPIKIVVE
jgi:eukaryotic-like serine/threonine-protein kinase